KGDIIYIGKAKVLRNRVRSYFQSSRDDGPKHRRLVSKIADFELIVLDSEIEALILEANLIKEYRPRYNVNLKDDKSFPFIRVTNEPFPRIFPTRKLIRDGSQYFGPYTDVRSMKALLKTVRKIFPLRTCTLDLTDDNIRAGKFKVCLNYHIKRCLGPCEGHIPLVEYNEMVKDVVSFINGRDTRIVKRLQQRMQAAAEAKRFEEAARLRDQISFIEEFQYKQKVVAPDKLDRDIIALATDEDNACTAIFKVREGKILGKQHFFMDGVAEESTSTVLGFFIKQYYMKAEQLPAEIYLPETIDDVEAVHEWLVERFSQEVKFVIPQIGDKARLVRMCAQNAKLALGELMIQKMKSADYIPHSVKALQQDLHLEHPPMRIEAFDISNIQGTDPVASMVCFIDGKPRKKEYRKFKIRGKETPDDFAMMAEVLKRRYSRLQREKQPFPDLILIDGGKGQLGAALQSLHEIGVDNQPIISLAKRLDEVFVPGISDPQNIPRSSSGLRMLQQLRDESHRFAITFHRSLRQKRTLHSILDEIPGVGPSRRKNLLKEMGSLKKIKAATVEELSSVTGISTDLATAIFQFLQPNTPKKEGPVK
ncbi:excinuclease ABC subunit C, partial [bacterium]|nr:excinuclease ABC subunit C [bacterium]